MAHVEPEDGWPRGRERIIVAIHGILTLETPASWHQRFKQFAWREHPEIEVFHREYFAGFIPAWNVFFRNKRHAAALAAALVPYLKAGAEVSFVTHSNGADIGVKTIAALASAGFKTRALVAIGAAIQSDVEKSGIAQLLDAGSLGRAIAYCSTSDGALKLKAKWPYGDLGRRGFTLNGTTYYSIETQTRWFAGYGHSDYFAPDLAEATFRQVIADS